VGHRSLDMVYRHYSHLRRSDRADGRSIGPLPVVHSVSDGLAAVWSRRGQI